jgi:methionyl-tRNA synthetase
MKKNYDGKIPEPGELTEAESTIKSHGESLGEIVNKKINAMRLNEAIEETMQYIRSVNKYMEDNAPWKLVKNDKAAAGRVLYTAGEALRISAVLLSPVMPNRTEILLNALNAQGTGLAWGGLTPGNELKDHDPLFPRVK